MDKLDARLYFVISGIEAVVIDYIRPSLFHGKTLIPRIAQGCVWILSAFTLGALYYFNYTDVGLVSI
jgi:succinate dehydrogenase (ubiquinone) membrane anchor subunit